MTKTLELVFASPQHNDDYKVRVQKAAAATFRANITKLTSIVTVLKYSLTQIVETEYSVRNIQHVAYIVRFTIELDAPATDIASRALEACFVRTLLRKPVSGDNFVLIDRTAT